VPFDKEEDFHFVATAYYLSPAVRAHWEKTLGGQIIWQATTMDIIADFLDRVVAERGEAGKRTGLAAKTGTRPPFATGGTNPGFGSKGPFSAGGSKPATPLPPGNTQAPMPT
jgi:hypothetical protein